MSTCPDGPETSVAPLTRPAGLFRRLAALFYDGLLLLAVLFLATLLVLPLAGGAAVQAGNPFFQTYLLLVAFLYFAVPWVRTGQTLGLKSWRLHVERLDGGPLTWWHALLRFLAAAPALLLLGLGLLWMLVDRDRLTLYDRWSGTRVIHRR